MSSLTAFFPAYVAAPSAASNAAKASLGVPENPLDSAMLPARNPTHTREETLMKPLDAAVMLAPERSIRPSQPAEATRDEQRGHGQLISAGSLRDLDVGVAAEGNDADQPAPAPGHEYADDAAMPNFLDRQEVNAMIRKLRQSVSLWKRIQNVRVDEQRLEQMRDELLSHQQLIR